MDMRGTESEKNLRAALSGESMARNKYTYYAMAARAEGYEEIAEEFERLALNEMQHAKLWFQYINGSCKSTAENLKDAANGEFEEWHSMYPAFAKKAREEGFEELAKKFEGVAAIERDHEMQFMMLCGKLLSGKERPAPEAAKAAEPETRNGYRCIFCGAVFDERPDVCDVCQAIGSFEPCVYLK